MDNIENIEISYNYDIYNYDTYNYDTYKKVVSI